MKKRLIAAALWFFALSSIGGFAEVFFKVPADLGSLIGIAVAILVVFDPTRHVWGDRRVSAVRGRSAASTHA